MTKLSPLYAGLPVRLSVPGQPVPKARPRVYNGHGITPAKTKAAEARIKAEYLKKYAGCKPFDQEIIMHVAFYMSDRRRVDYDNLAKLVTDALNGVAYVDDSQIMESIIYKVLPSTLVEGRRGVRQRRKGDTLDWEPHTEIRLEKVQKPTESI